MMINEYLLTILGTGFVVWGAYLVVASAAHRYHPGMIIAGLTEIAGGGVALYFNNWWGILFAYAAPHLVRFLFGDPADRPFMPSERHLAGAGCFFYLALQLCFGVLGNEALNLTRDGVLLCAAVTAILRIPPTLDSFQMYTIGAELEAGMALPDQRRRTYIIIPQLYLITTFFYLILALLAAYVTRQL
jgi:hypothetical protein